MEPLYLLLYPLLQLQHFSDDCSSFAVTQFIWLSQSKYRLEINEIIIFLYHNHCAIFLLSINKNWEENWHTFRLYFVLPQTTPSILLLGLTLECIHWYKVTRWILFTMYEGYKQCILLIYTISFRRYGDMGKLSKYYCLNLRQSKYLWDKPNEISSSQSIFWW